MWMIHSLYHCLLILLFPSACYLCGKEGTSLCGTCITFFRRSVDTPHTYIYSYFSFKDSSLRKCIHASKYYHRPDLIEPLTKATYQEFLPLITSLKNPYFVPIPAHRLRIWMRGYNQAEKIAREYSKLYSAPLLLTTLLQKKASKSQAHTKNRKERLTNKKHSFSVAEGILLHDKDIILVDDVTTTGSTLHEARKKLLDSGARSVTAITLPH